ncbi:MAG: ankyrin repeat domain-containing protein [Deltaproteobacteria bacterium]|nr:ankyrin repeat domain-containing protein [Deltaproteobacteria bacterium]
MTILFPVPLRRCAFALAALCLPVFANAAMPDADFVALCETGTAAQVHQALKNGANAKARDKDGFRALGMAAMRDSDDPEAVFVVQALLDAGADVNGRDCDGETALMKAAEYRSDIRVVRALLAAGADANVRNRYGSTPLREAAGYAQNLPVVQALLAAGAQVDARNGNDGCTALARAAQRHNDVQVVETLLDAGANANARCRDGSTPLMQAAIFSGYEVVAALLDAGADKSLKDNDGHDALWHARESAREGSRAKVVADPSVRQTADYKVLEALQDGTKQTAPERDCSTAATFLPGEWEWLERPGARPFFLKISPEPGNCRFAVEALWPHSPADYYVWTFSGEWNPATHTLDYKGGRHFRRIMPLEPERTREEETYRDGTGTLRLQDGTLFWDERREQVCTDCRFTKSGI